MTGSVEETAGETPGEEISQAFIDSLPVGVIHWDRRRDPVYRYNAVARQNMGIAPGVPFPSRGSAMSGMVEPYRTRVAEAIRRGAPFDGRVTVTSPSGEVRHLRLRTRGDRERGWAITSLAPDDGTEDGETDAEESPRHPRFAPLFEHSRVAMLLVDPTGLILTANEAAARLLGRSSVRELLPHRLEFRHLIPDDALRDGLFADLREHGYVAGREVPLTRADGSLAWVRLDLAVNEADGLIEVVATDIGLEREHRIALGESERRYRGIFEGAVVGVVQLTIGGGILAANRYSARTFGYDTVEGFLARASREVPDAMAAFDAEIERLRAGMQDDGARESRIEAADGAERWIRVRSHIDAATGTVNVFLADITSERQAEAERERALRELELQATERRQLVRRLLQVGEDERRLVAHEIHDGPVQLLAGALMFLTSAQQEQERGRDALAEDYIERGATYLRTALAEIRRVMAHLRPAVLDDLGLLSAIHNTAEASLEPYRMRVRVDQLGEAAALDASTEMVLFRVAQEATTNAGKHSGGREVAITIDYREADHVVLTVEDDGKGFDTEATFAAADGHHLGLLGLRERVYLVDGGFAIRSTGEGTRITVQVPRRNVPSEE